MAGVYQAGYLTGVDHLIPERLVENSIAERAGTIIKFGFGDWDLDKQLHFGPFVLFSTQDIIILCSKYLPHFLCY